MLQGPDRPLAAWALGVPRAHGRRFDTVVVKQPAPHILELRPRRCLHHPVPRPYRDERSGHRLVAPAVDFLAIGAHQSPLWRNGMLRLDTLRMVEKVEDAA